MASESLSAGEAVDRKPSDTLATILQWKRNDSRCRVRQEAPAFFTSPVARFQALSCCFIMELFSGLCAFKPRQISLHGSFGFKVLTLSCFSVGVNSGAPPFDVCVSVSESLM